MKRLAALMSLLAGQAAAVDLDCTLTDVACVTVCPETTATFTIDLNQFVAPQDPNDPPRRQITRVTLNADTFTADAIAFADGTLGFHHGADTSDRTLLIIQPDGAARLSRLPDNQILTGRCSRS